MLYSVEIRPVYDLEPIVLIVLYADGQDALSRLCFMLEADENTGCYSVHSRDISHIPSDFGWSNSAFPKWLV